MDSSELSVTRTTDAPPTLQHGVMARSLISATIFGTIGATIGHWLGRNLNKVVASTLKWTMGTFWAVVAAYSSFKAAEIDQRAAAVALKAEIIPVNASSQESIAPSTKAPLSLIEVDTLSRDGAVQEMQHLQR